MKNERQVAIPIRWLHTKGTADLQFSWGWREYGSTRRAGGSEKRAGRRCQERARSCAAEHWIREPKGLMNGDTSGPEVESRQMKDCVISRRLSNGPFVLVASRLDIP